MVAPLFQRGQVRGTRTRTDTRDAIARACLETLEDRRLLSFEPAVSYPAGTSPEEVVTADFNNDGRLDLAVANPSTDSVNVLLGDGNGTFQSPQPSAAGDSPFSVAVGDFNDDGLMDLAAGDGANGGVNVMFGNGDGTFRAPGHVAAGYPIVNDVAAGDLNEDGRMDLVVSSNYRPAGYYGYPQGRADVLLAIGDGSFATERTLGWPDRAFGDAVVADLNGDGHLDLVTELSDYSSIIVALGDGQGNFGGSRGTEAYGSHPSAAGDLNGDGKTDLVTREGVLFGNGTGGFTSPYPDGSVAAGSNVLADFDRDGMLEGAIGAAGDFNGDGWLDLTTVNSGGDSVSVAINDQSWPPVPPTPPTVSVNDVTVTEGNTGVVNATFTVTLSKPSAADVTVRYSTADVYFPSALAGSDYTAASGTLTIPSGQTSGTFSVEVIGDRLMEPAEQFVVTLSDPSNATIADSWGIGTILDDEPRISVSGVTKSEGNGKTGTAFSFTVRLSAAYDAAVTVNYATANGTAAAGSDYEAKAGSVTFAPGETVKTITVLVYGDKARESNETFFLDVFGAGDTVLGAVRGLATILNDDR